MSYRFVRVDEHDAIVTIALDRPPANAVELDLLRDLRAALDAVAGDPRIRALVLTGSGACFCGGLDLKVVPRYTRAEQRELLVELSRAMARLYGLGIPTVAAVNGHAVAAGTLMTLACDARVGPTMPCRFGLTGARVGIPYPMAALEIIRAELAPGVVRRMILGAETFDAGEALQRGILDELEPPDRIVPRAMEIARDRSSMPLASYARIKHEMRRGALGRISHALDSDADPFLEDWMNADSISAATDALRKS